MRGIGTLNETARNMFRGPRGIGAYQQFASGGEAMGPPPLRGPDPQGIGYFQQFANGGDVVGEQTGEQTSVGRDVYLTPDGERVSEESLTFEVDGIFVNVPSIQDGIRYSSDQVYEMMMNGEIQPTSAHKTEEEAISAAKARSDSLIKKFADGGPVYMSNGGESKDTRSEYRRTLALQESGDKLDAFNEDENAMGLYQAIPSTLEDFKKQKDLSFSNDAFLNSKPLQESFQDWFEGKTLKYIKQHDLDKFVGKVVGGVPVTKSAMLAMAHLGGDFGMRQFLETNGAYNPGDANKTRLRDYGIQMSGLDIGEGPQDKVFSQEEITAVALQSPPEEGPVRPRLRPEFLSSEGVTTSLRPQLRPQGIMSIQDPAVMDRVQEELPPTEEERDLYEKYSPENMFPDAGLTEWELERRRRFAPKEGDAEPYRQPPSTLEQIDRFFQRFAPSRKPERVIQPKYTPEQYRDA